MPRITANLSEVLKSLYHSVMSIFPIAVIASFVLMCTSCSSSSDWRTADRSSVGIAPLPEDEPAAIVHVYTARAFSWRGYFAVHSWIATKEKNAKHYLTYHVTGFRNGANVQIRNDIPDRRWFGATPTLIQALKGEKAEAAIPKITAAAKSYPYQNIYRLWPGPNSNTFISYIIRHTDELGVELPPHAIGKDWIGQGDFFGQSESKTGYQFSLYGAAGLTVGLAEGLELNLLGLNFGLDLWRPAIKLPFVGRLGFSDAPVFD